MPLNPKELYRSVRSDWHAAQAAWSEGLEGISPIISASTNEKITADSVRDLYHGLVEVQYPTDILNYSRIVVDNPFLKVTTARMVLATDDTERPVVGLHIFQVERSKAPQPEYSGTVRVQPNHPPYGLKLGEILDFKMRRILADQIDFRLADEFISEATKHGYALNPTSNLR